MATLMKGDKHKGVAILQDKLNRMGASPLLAVDGDFGNYTRAAVRKFQADQPRLQCAYAGVAGPKTLDALGIRFEVEQLTVRFPLMHQATANWAAYLSVERFAYPQSGLRNSDPGQILDTEIYIGTAFILSGYKTLLGGRITQSNGVYTFHNVGDPDKDSMGTDDKKFHNNECAALVQAFGLPPTKAWRKGPRVKDLDSVRPGTVIATLRDDKYYSDYSGRSHVAIFDSKTDKGIYVYDQWNGADINKRFKGYRPEDPGDQHPFPLNKNEREYSWTSDGDEYYILNSTEQVVTRDYD